VPLPESLDDLRWRGIPDKPFDEWCAQLNVTGLRERARARM
jgi:hypothetical protein